MIRTGDRVDVADAIDRHDPGAGCTVVLEHRGGVLAVDDQALGQAFGGVVAATLGRGALEDPSLELVVGDLEGDHPGHPVRAGGEHGVQRDRLGHGSRESIEEDALGGVGLVEAALDHADHQVVGHQPAGVHDRLGLTAERRVVSDLVAQHVPGGDMRDAEAHRHARRLGSLAAPGRPEHQRNHPAIT